MSTEVADAFEGLLARLDRLGYSIREFLQPPASVEYLMDAQMRFGHQFPSAMVDLYSIHNGSKNVRHSLLFPSLRFLPIESALNLAEVWVASDVSLGPQAEQSVSWESHFLPVLKYEDVSNLAIECGSVCEAPGRVVDVQNEFPGYIPFFPSLPSMLTFFCLAIDEGLVECPSTDELTLKDAEYVELHSREFPGFGY
jgi:hypothetical protein